MWGWTIAGFSPNQISAYFPVWSRCIPNSGDPLLSFSMGYVGGWCAALLGGNCCSSILSTNQNVRNSIVRRDWETCNLRVTWPAGSHRRGPVEHAGCQTRNQSGLDALLPARPLCLCGTQSGGQMRCLYNKLTSFVLLIIICHLWERNKGYNHGYSESALRKRRRKTNPHIALNLFTLTEESPRTLRNIFNTLAKWAFISMTLCAATCRDAAVIVALSGAAHLRWHDAGMFPKRLS